MLKGLQSIIGRFQTRSAFASFPRWWNLLQQRKRMDWLLKVLEAKIFRYNFMEGHNVWGNVRYSSSIHRNIVAILATNFQDLVAKVKNLVALTPVLGAIWRPAYSLLFTVFEAVLKLFERFSAGGSVPLEKRLYWVGYVLIPSDIPGHSRFLVCSRPNSEWYSWPLEAIVEAIVNNQRCSETNKS